MFFQPSGELSTHKLKPNVTQ